MVMTSTNESPWEVRAEDFPHAGTAKDRLQFLLRYAILAPSTWNTQPWKFVVEEDAVTLLADVERWQPMADADQRELYISLGCALENLRIAALHFGYDMAIKYDPCEERAGLPVAACISLSGPQRPPTNSPDFLFDAIPHRHTAREVYEPYALPREGLAEIQECSADGDVRLQMMGDPFLKAKMDVLLAQADAQQFADPSYRQELLRSMSQRGVEAPWLLSAMGHLATAYLRPSDAAHPGEATRNASAPLIGLLSSHDDSRSAQVQTGQTLERIWLTATSFGLYLHPISQITQVPGTREELARLLLTPDQVPQIPFRLGYAQADRRHSPRRPLEEALIKTQ